MLVEGRIETTSFRKIFVFWQLVGLDTAAVVEYRETECRDPPPTRPTEYF
jgi:hypothetical protein